MLELITSLGMSRKNAEVYLFIAANGPVQVRTIAIGMPIGKQQAYGIIRQLQKKGVVIASSARPVLLSAVSFDQAIDILSKHKRKSVQALEKNREEILSKWQSITTNKL
jgi:sugar-specific transcriptional regulator TrmB